ncbi:MAG TPA: DUF2278 family protein [Thermoanaerobaculia bacterium]|nr:DUF2278 family protein [Thermoanaerobaculia bacterium]
MPIQSYGVLRGKAIEGKLAGQGNSKPHYQIHIKAAGVDHRIAVNVVSDQAPSELLFLLDPDFHHTVLSQFGDIKEGFNALKSQAGGKALDFIRGNYFDPKQMTLMPFDAPGTGNDLHEIFDLYVKRAIDRGADVYAFGSKWGPEKNKPDQYFGFKPGNGIHDIHMNQGNPKPHAGDNGVWQDGALFIHFPQEDKWLAFFLAFQSQFGQTDAKGNPLPGSPLFGNPTTPVDTPVKPPIKPDQPPVVVPATAGVRIVAAMVNPPGDDAGHETVTLLNTRPESMSLSGWKIENGAGAQFTIQGPSLAPGDTVRITLTDLNVPLSNKGGAISLLDPKGGKIDGVSYTQDQASAQGWTIVF